MIWSSSSEPDPRGVALSGDDSIAYRQQYRPITPGYRQIVPYSADADAGLQQQQSSAVTKDLVLMGGTIAGGMAAGPLASGMSRLGGAALRTGVLGGTLASFAMPFSEVANRTRMTRELKNARGVDAMKTSQSDTHVPFDYVCESWRSKGIRIAPELPSVKTSAAAPVRIVSAMQKEASISPLLREALGMNPVGEIPMSTPTVAIGDRLRTAYGYTPKKPGDLPRAANVAAELADILGSALNKSEIVVNNAGVPIGKNVRFMGGPLGSAMKIPLAIGGVLALNEAYKAIQKGRHNRNKERAFNNMMDLIEADPSFLDSAGRSLRASRREDWEKSLRGGFDIAYEYAPTVSKDPRLLAHYTTKLTTDPDYSPPADEYLNRVSDLARLEQMVAKNEPSLANLLSPAASAMMG